MANSHTTETVTTNTKHTDERDELIRKIINGVREFYLGLLSHHLTHKQINAVRDEQATASAVDAVMDRFSALLADDKAGGEVVLYQYRWLNPAGSRVNPESMLDWKLVELRNLYTDTIEDAVRELKWYRYDGKPVYEVRPLYTRPQPQAELQAENERLKVDLIAERELSELKSEEISELRAQLAELTAENERLQESDDMLREIGTMCRDQTRFVGSYSEIVKQALGELAALAAQEPVAIAEVIDCDTDWPHTAKIQWILNPMLNGMLLYEEPRLAAKPDVEALAQARREALNTLINLRDQHCANTGDCKTNGTDCEIVAGMNAAIEAIEGMK